MKSGRAEEGVHSDWWVVRWNMGGWDDISGRFRWESISSRWEIWLVLGSGIVNWGSRALWLMVNCLHPKYPLHSSACQLFRGHQFAQMSSLLKMSHNGCRMIACENSEWIISGPNWPQKKTHVDSNNAFCLGPDELFRAKHWHCQSLSYLHPLLKD